MRAFLSRFVLTFAALSSCGAPAAQFLIDHAAKHEGEEIDWRVVLKLSGRLGHGGPKQLIHVILWPREAPTITRVQGVTKYSCDGERGRRAKNEENRERERGKTQQQKRGEGGNIHTRKGEQDAN